MSSVEDFYQENARDSLPKSESEKVRTIAKELATGAHRRLWSSSQFNMPSDHVGGELVPGDRNVYAYMEKRLGESEIGHYWGLLFDHGYLIQLAKGNARISQSAFALVD